MKHIVSLTIFGRYGWNIKGRPAFLYIANAAHGYGVGCSAMCSMTLDGMRTITISEHMIDNNIFMETLQNDVLPAMNPFPHPRSVLVMDNATVHNPFQVHNACQGHGVLPVFLPPYSYDFNPIELAFHQAKNYIRDRYALADGVCAERLYEGLASVQSIDACHYYRHCGYYVSEADVEWVNAI